MRELLINDKMINPCKTCAVTGHRGLNKDFDNDKLVSALKEVIADGYDCFLIGMALGFDTECFHALEELRKTENITLIACVPCKDQDKKFNEEQKKEYKRMLSSADEVTILSNAYTDKCMLMRNKYMIDRCSALIAYLRRKTGGTFYTVNYAERTGKKIIFI